VSCVSDGVEENVNIIKRLNKLLLSLTTVFNQA